MEHPVVSFALQHRVASRQIKYYTKSDLSLLTTHLGKPANGLVAGAASSAGGRRRRRGAGGEESSTPGDVLVSYGLARSYISYQHLVIVVLACTGYTS